MRNRGYITAKGPRAGERESGRAGERRLSCGLMLCSLVTLVLLGCSGNSTMEQVRQAMYDQPKYEPLERSAFYANGMGTRVAPKGTVARGRLKTDKHLYEGRVNGELAVRLPFELTDEVMARGRERYNIFCSPCHGALGAGDGMVVRRGMKAPPSFHIDRLRSAPVGHTFDVISSGFGAMYSYASRIPVHDRWAIVAYVKALQLSQNATIKDVPEASRSELEVEE